MQLTFLQGQEPYTKTYEKRPDGTYKGSSYPNVFLVSSHTENITGLAEFAEKLKVHATAGHCLLTNNLEKHLENESRAKHQKKDEPRKWVVLDVDGLEGVDSIEEFIKDYLPEPFHNASYIVQYSPSHGIKPGLRCHLYFILYDEVSAESVTQWLTWHNVTHPILSNQVTLSKSAMSLTYQVDRVASANGRIIYIAPPECVGFEDPVPNRINVVEKDYEKLSFGFVCPSPAEVRARVREQVNILRDARGLSKKNAKEHVEIRADGSEVLKKDLIDQGRITSCEADNDKFMRCNINDGDSWAYYFHRDTEHPLLHNFKGEPSMLLEAFDPKFYREQVVPHFEKLSKNFPRPFVFRDFATDKMFVGVREDEEITKQPAVIGASDKKIGDFFVQYGQTSPPAIIPTWDRLFDPTLPKQWYPDDEIFNTWRPTEYQQNTMYTSSVPPTIEKVIRHVTGNDEETYNRFINWLAYIQQTRKKAGTAWVLHGVPGTGKGLLFHYILSPIMGHDYCQTKQIRDLKDKFNGWMEQCILCNIDEANAEDLSFEGKEVINSLKNWITEPRITVRHMQASPVNRNSFINFIFTTNDFGILPIQEGDRRINVAPRQTVKLEITDDEIKELKNELSRFSSYLASYKVNKSNVIKPMENKAKEDLKAAARTSIDEFFHAAQEGDLVFFAEGQHEDSSEYSAVATFKEAVERWIKDAKDNEPSLVTVPELKAAHVVMCRDRGMKSGQFKSMAAKRGFPPSRPRVGDNRGYGWKVDWKLSEEDKKYLKMHLKAVKTPAELEEKIKSEIESSSD
jgi:hypothetical protein